MMEETLKNIKLEEFLQSGLKLITTVVILIFIF